MPQNSLKVTWLTTGRRAEGPADPKYPNGMDIDQAGCAKFACMTRLPYPAPCCGTYVIECSSCGIRVGVTAAGRKDDPRVVKIRCKFPSNSPPEPPTYRPHSIFNN